MPSISLQSCQHLSNASRRALVQDFLDDLDDLGDDSEWLHGLAERVIDASLSGDQGLSTEKLLAWLASTNSTPAVMEAARNLTRATRLELFFQNDSSASMIAFRSKIAVPCPAPSSSM